MTYKRSIPIAIVLMSIALFGYGQNNGEKGEQYLGLRSSYTHFEGGYAMYGVGFDFQWYASDRLVLNYHLQFGGDSRNKFHAHSYLGGATAVFLGLNAIGEDTEDSRALSIIGAILALIVPEGVGYDAKVGDNFHLSPFLNPLGFHLADENGLSGEIGLAADIWIDNLKISPYIAGEALYTSPLKKGLGTGISVSFELE